MYTSSNSSLVIHISVNVEIEVKIDPPIQTQYFLSGTATTLIFAAIFGFARFLSSFVSLSGKENFVNNVSEIFVQENAYVEYNKIQDAENENYHVSTEQVLSVFIANYGLHLSVIHKLFLYFVSCESTAA